MLVFTKQRGRNSARDPAVMCDDPCYFVHSKKDIGFIIGFVDCIGYRITALIIFNLLIYIIGMPIIPLSGLCLLQVSQKSFELK